MSTHQHVWTAVLVGSVIVVIFGLLALFSPSNAVMISRFESIDIGTTPPTTCIAERSIFFNTSAQTFNLCNASGTGYVSYGGGGGGSSTTGIRTSATEIETYRDKVTAVSGNSTLSLDNVVFVTVSTGGSVQTLPDAADTAKPGKYKLRIADTGTGLLSVAPSAGNIINGSATAWPGITGQFAGYDIERLSTTQWHLTSISTVPVGEFAGGLCRGVNGSTNIATVTNTAIHTHSLTCVIPANTLQQGSTFDACSTFTVVTGSTAPTLAWVLQANSAFIDGNHVDSPLVLSNNIVGRTVNLCTRIIAAAAPGAAVTLHTGPIGTFSALNSAIDAHWITPQALPTNAAITLTWSSAWSSTGAAANANTFQQTAMSGQHIR